MRPVAHLTVVFLILITATGCQTMRALELRSTRIIIPSEQEAQIGKSFSQEIEGEVEIMNDPVATAWVNSLGQKLVQNSPPCAQTFTFKVTTSDEVNAFAIPGGYCYVNAGLIRLAANEAEVAAVVGHEINHVTARHGVRSIQRQIGIQKISELLGSDPDSQSLISAIQGAGGVLAMRSFGREDEREADRLGADAMYKAGYDPRAAVAFFEKMQGAAPGSDSALSRIVSTHPATPERIANLREQVSRYDLSHPMILDTPEFNRVKARIGSN